MTDPPVPSGGGTGPAVTTQRRLTVRWGERECRAGGRERAPGLVPAVYDAGDGDFVALMGQMEVPVRGVSAAFCPYVENFRLI